MIAECHVDIEKFNSLWTKVIEKRSKPKASLIFSCDRGKDFTIQVKTKGSLGTDFFVTQKLSIHDKSKALGKFSLKIPEFYSILLVSETSEHAIQEFLDTIANNNKENTPSKPLINSKIRPDSSSPPDVHYQGKKLLVKTPNKKRFANHNTPSKQQQSLLGGGHTAPVATEATPQSRRKQPRLKVSSPAVRFPNKTMSPSGHRKQSKTGSSSSTSTTSTCALTEEQENVLAAAMNGTSIFFTGGAGTGKTLVLLHLVEQLVQKHGQHTVFVTATTGLAACAIGGITVHQFAGITVSSNDSDGVEGDEMYKEEVIKSALQKPHIVRRLRQARVLVVDEISMMAPSLLEVLNAIAQGGRASSLPMGGLQIILTGDFFQLPPVLKHTLPFAFHQLSTQPPHNTQIQPILQHCFTFTQGSQPSQSQQQRQEKADPSNTVKKVPPPRFCFQSSVWKQILAKPCQSFVLSQVFRQKDPEFVSLLDAVRWGEVTEQVQSSLKECIGRKFDCEDGILPTRLFTHRKDVDHLNTKELTDLPGVAVEYHAIDTGESIFLRVLQSHCPARSTLKLKIGAQVILVKNVDARDGLVNGAKGVVLRFTRDTKRPVVRFSEGIERVVMNEVFTVVSAGKVVAQRTQLPLDLAWGLSVHKSQGMTVDKAIVHLRKVFEYGQAYVALSRVRSKAGLSIDTSLIPSQVKAHPDVASFYRNMEKEHQKKEEKNR